jgi:glycosyltransferase involved in cell wall biosynthesis
MRISVDCRYVRERPSGIGAYVEELVDRVPFAAPKDRFVFWAHERARDPLTDAPNAQATTVAVEPNSLWTLRRPHRYASFRGVDVFHSPHNVRPQDIRCPSVVTVHDLLPLEHPQLAFIPWSQRLKRWYYVNAIWRAHKNSTRLIATTTVMADRIARFVPEARQKAQVIPMGVAEKFRPASDGQKRAAVVTASDLPYFLVVGQDAPHKRHAIALRAFARYAPEDHQLILVQRTGTRSPLARMIDELGLTGRVKQFPHLAADGLVALYQGATALIQPSVYDGFGLPLLEAMACGSPVIATDIPMFREVIGGAGMFAPIDDVDAFGRAILAVATDTSRRSDLSAAGIRRVSAFTWDRCASLTVDAYRVAASCGAGHS